MRRKSSKQYYKHYYGQKGFSLVETLVAAAILGISITGVSALQTQLMRTVTTNNDRSFASQKATQMFEELRGFVQANREEPLKSLQDYFHNGVTEFPATLTIEKRPDPNSPNNRRQDLYLEPTDMLSQNTRTGDGGQEHWRYVRQVTVEPVQNDENSRHVTVKVWYANQQNEPKNLDRPLAVVSGILKTNIDQTPPTQVYDMYILAAENMPGWWVDVSALRPVFNRVIDDLASRNPGLEIREHYIGRLGYGRDPFYTPYINSANDLGATNIPFVYFYPGNVSGSTSDATVSEVYVDSEIQGYRRNDTQVNNLFKTTDSLTPNSTNKNGAEARDYALADQFNNAMRYPQEAAMYRRLNDSNSFNRSEAEPSLRLLLDGMQLIPDAYRNSQLINVHGELVPLPPVRNYSDPAKLPYDESDLAVSTATRTYNSTHLGIPFGDLDQNRQRYMNMRVVAHPENLSYTNTQDMSLRVYGYQTIPLGATALPNLPSSAFNNTDRENFEASHVEKTSIFIPSNGRVYNPSTVFANPGVTAPAFTADSSDLSDLNISKVVGNHRLPYQWRNAAGNAFMRITQNDTYYNTAAMPASQQLAYAAKNLLVQPLAFNGATANLLSSNQTLLPVIGGSSRIVSTNGGARQIVVNVRGTTAITTAQNAVLQQLVDSKVLINGEVVLDSSGTPIVDGQPRSISRIQTVQSNTPSNGRVTLTLYGPVPPAAVANALVTRMRDYDINVNPADVFGNTESGYLITLYDTPTRHPRCGSVSGVNCLTSGNTTGYDSNRLLYRQEYYPAPVTNSFAQGQQDLTTSGSGFKNTARWQVSLGNALSNRFNDNMIAFETRIGRAYDWSTAFRSDIQSDLLEEGLSYHGDPYQEDNLSTTSVNEHSTVLRNNLYNASYTYTWRGNSKVPPSEKYQYLGDPRLMPYLDAKVQHRYNPKFHNFDLNNNNVTGYVQDTANDVRDDFLRFGKLYMDGLTKSNSIYNSISGFSNYYYGLGGDLGADGNNTQYNVNVQPFSEGNDTSSVAVSDSNRIGDLGGGHSRIVFSSRNSNTDGTRWIGLHWMGEVFPDEEYKFWKYNGNLPTRGYNNGNHNACGNIFASSLCSAATEDYFKGQHNTLPLNIADRHHNPGTIGSPTFMNGNTTGSGSRAFGHESTSGTGILTNVSGSELNRAFNLSLESRPQSTRPFLIDKSDPRPGLYDDTRFLANERNTLSFLNVSTGANQSSPNQQNVFYIYDNNSWITSGLVKVTNRSNEAAFVLVNGLAQANQSSKTTIARFSVAGMLQAYMLGGDVTDGVGDDVNRTRPIPRVQITRPSPADIYEDPSTISVEFDAKWERWDQEPYAPLYGATSNWYDETEMVFIGKYSTDAGSTWRNLDGSTSSKGIGIYDASGVISSVGQVPLDADGENYSFSWDVNSIPAGRYLLRIEAHRVDSGTNQVIGTGYAYHQSYVSIRRN
jgi:prepilin-type N-terminal cleavage/methylation domain-containing protein